MPEPSIMRPFLINRSYAMVISLSAPAPDAPGAFSLDSEGERCATSAHPPPDSADYTPHRAPCPVPAPKHRPCAAPLAAWFARRPHQRPARQSAVGSAPVGLANAGPFPP